jgi:hypothetical protein
MSWLKKRHLQISLRSSLLLFCLTCCAVAYLADVKKRQVEVQKTVRELGGFVWNVDFNNDRCIEPSRIAFLPDCFYVVLPERCNYVYVTSPEVDDNKLAQILKLPGIEGLNISWSTITDKGLLMLKEKSGWKEIQLYDIPTVTEEAILQLEASTCCAIKH